GGCGALCNRAMLPRSALKASRGQTRWLRQQIEEWRARSVIDEDTATQLRDLYPRPSASEERPLAQVLMVCLGALLIAAGIILVLAHNWEELPRPLRAVIAYACVGSGHVLAFWTLGRRPQSAAWREATGA